MRFLVPIVFILSCSLFAQNGSKEVDSEIIEREKALLEIKQKMLDEELTGFFTERQRWERNKKARVLLMNRYEIDENEILPKRLRAREINKVVSSVYMPLMEELSEVGGKVELTVIKVSVSENGKVLKSSIVSTESNEHTSLRLLQEAAKMDFTELKGNSKAFEHIYAVLIRRKK